MWRYKHFGWLHAHHTRFELGSQEIQTSTAESIPTIMSCYRPLLRSGCAVSCVQSRQTYWVLSVCPFQQPCVSSNPTPPAIVKLTSHAQHHIQHGAFRVHLWSFSRSLRGGKTLDWKTTNIPRPNCPFSSLQHTGNNGQAIGLILHNPWAYTLRIRLAMLQLLPSGDIQTNSGLQNPLDFFVRLLWESSGMGRHQGSQGMHVWVPWCASRCVQMSMNG